MNKDYLSKVPEVALGFWFIKILATTLGEVGGNAVSMTLEMGYLLGSIIFFVPLVFAVIAQIKAKKFNGYLYWGTITLTTLAGTTLADFFDRSLDIGYLGGSLSLFALVVITLGVWKWSLGSIEIETVNTPKTEIFYWTTIMFSQTLGTALGDWMADSTGLGYVGSALVIAATLLLIVGLYYFTEVSRTALFWAAFILTRPLGATVANSLDKAPEKGGLGISDLTATAVIAVIMIVSLLIIPQRAARKRTNTNSELLPQST